MRAIHKVEADYGYEYWYETEYIVCDPKDELYDDVKCSNDWKNVTCKRCLRSSK